MADNTPQPMVPPRGPQRWELLLATSLLLGMVVLAVARPEQHYGTMSRAILCTVLGVAVALLTDTELANRLTMLWRVVVFFVTGGVAASAFAVVMEATTPTERVVIVEVVNEHGKAVPLSALEVGLTPESGVGSATYGTNQNLLFVVFPDDVGRMDVELEYVGGPIYHGSVTRPASGRLRLRLADDHGKFVLLEEQIRR